MPESPPPYDNRRPRFRSRGSAPEAETTEESTAHQPPAPETLLSLPLPANPVEAPPEPDLDQPVFASLTLGPAPSPPTPEAEEQKGRDRIGKIVPDGEKPGVQELQLPNWTRPSRPPPPLNPWWFILGGVALAAIGFLAGFGLHDLLSRDGSATGPRAEAAIPRLGRVTGSGERLTPEAQAALDGAFALMRTDKPQDAREQFAALIKKHPGWPQLALEQARAAFYQHDGVGAKSILDNAEKAGLLGSADAAFMGGLLKMTAGDFVHASETFEHAASWDPTRDDVYYFWGECLRRQGKPAESVIQFRAAILRNQKEAMAGFYQFKLWLAEIQGNLDAASGTSARLDAELAAAHPSGYALAAAAARSLRSENPAIAAGFLERAAQILDPSIFQLVLRDSLFAQEAYRPEFAPLYAPPPAPASP